MTQQSNLNFNFYDKKLNFRTENLVLTASAFNLEDNINNDFLEKKDNSPNKSKKEVVLKKPNLNLNLNNLKLKNINIHNFDISTKAVNKINITNLSSRNLGRDKKLMENNFSRSTEKISDLYKENFEAKSKCLNRKNKIIIYFTLNKMLKR